MWCVIFNNFRHHFNLLSILKSRKVKIRGKHACPAELSRFFSCALRDRFHGNRDGRVRSEIHRARFWGEPDLNFLPCFIAKQSSLLFKWFFEIEAENLQISHLKFLCSIYSALLRVGYVISELKALNFNGLKLTWPISSAGSIKSKWWLTSV